MCFFPINWPALPGSMATGDRYPAARAHRAFEQRSQEQHVQDAITWLRAEPGRVSKEAAAKFPLVGSAGALRQQMAKRNLNGILLHRPENDVLTDSEKDQLIQSYLGAGFLGEMPSPAKILIQSGVIDLLHSRGHPQNMTTAELKLTAPDASRYAYSSCQMIAEMAKLVFAGRTTAIPPFKLLVDLLPPDVRPQIVTHGAPPINVPLGGQVTAHRRIRCRLT